MNPEAIGEFQAFGRRFSERVVNWRAELTSLAKESAIYETWVLDEDLGGPGVYRVRFEPEEVYRYVQAVAAWDDFLLGGLEAVSDRQLADEAIQSARHRDHLAADELCPADFMGDAVEGLVCGWRLERAEKIRLDGTDLDAVLMMHEIANAMPTSVRSISMRGTAHPSFAIENERDLQDVLFLILRSVFHDAKREEWTPSLAGGSKRADIAIPSSRMMIEVKFARDQSHAKRIPDELKIDIESYHTHPSCGTIFAIVWDPNRHISDPQQVERDLTGSRSKGTSQPFDVVVRII